jgi:hypothetical protein
MPGADELGKTGRHRPRALLSTKFLVPIPNASLGMEPCHTDEDSFHFSMISSIQGVVHLPIFLQGRNKGKHDQ